MAAPIRTLFCAAPVRAVFCAALIGGVIATAPALRAEDRAAAFLVAIEEVPLMAGLTEEATPALDFDKPDGRLVETYAYGDVEADQTTEFYRAVMPEFGWQNIDRLVFLREGELLRIDLIREEHVLVVRFVLSPHSTQ